MANRSDDPPSFEVGAIVSARYKGAFCSATVQSVVRLVNVKVSFENSLLGTNVVLSDDNIRGRLVPGGVVEAFHAIRQEYFRATVVQIVDKSVYTVVYDDGDVHSMRRSKLCSQGARHFRESESLDVFPLLNPEAFGAPVSSADAVRGQGNTSAQSDETPGTSQQAAKAVYQTKKNWMPPPAPPARAAAGTPVPSTSVVAIAPAPSTSGTAGASLPSTSGTAGASVASTSTSTPDTPAIAAAAEPVPSTSAAAIASFSGAVPKKPITPKKASGPPKTGKRVIFKAKTRRGKRKPYVPRKPKKPMVKPKRMVDTRIMIGLYEKHPDRKDPHNRDVFYHQPPELLMRPIPQKKRKAFTPFKISKMVTTKMEEFDKPQPAPKAKPVARRGRRQVPAVKTFRRFLRPIERYNQKKLRTRRNSKGLASTGAAGNDENAEPDLTPTPEPTKPIGQLFKQLSEIVKQKKVPVPKEPPRGGKYNFIPDLGRVEESVDRFNIIKSCLSSLLLQYFDTRGQLDNLLALQRLNMDRN